MKLPMYCQIMTLLLKHIKLKQKILIIYLCFLLNLFYRVFNLVNQKRDKQEETLFHYCIKLQSIEILQRLVHYCFFDCGSSGTHTCTNNL